MYTQLAEIPVPTDGQFIAPDVVEITLSIRDHLRNIKRTTLTTITLTESSVKSSPLQGVDNPVLSRRSPSGARLAVLREVKQGADAKRYIEIWSDDRIFTSLDVTERHGAFYGDEWFSSLSFSHDESSIIYTAEGKTSESDDPYARFRFLPPLGEGLPGKKRPVLYVFQWDSNVISSSSSSNGTLYSIKSPVPVLFGQAVFSPSDLHIVYATGVEYSPDGRLLGIKGCHNRPTGIWQLRLSKESSDERVMKSDVLKLTAPHLSCRSPRVFSGDAGKFLIWLSAASGGAHISTSSIQLLDLSKDLGGSDTHINTIVDVVHNPLPGEFPGLYTAHNLPLSCFSIDDRNRSPSIILHSMWGSRCTILAISLDGKIKNITPDIDNQLFSWDILATDGNSRMICRRSNTNTPHEVLIGEFNSAGEVSWKVVFKPILPDQVKKALNELKTSIVTIPGRYPAETIVISHPTQNSGELLPCITVPHGGPHGTTTTAFASSTIALALEGYTISLPNYSGSPGFGENAINSLVGKCGTLDVEDCIASVRHLIDIGTSQEGPGKQLIMGGSHGGFLTAHLIGQFPDIFSAAVMRNPVISAGEISTSDIPDWYYAEFGFPYPITSAPKGNAAVNLTPATQRPPLMTPEYFSALHEMSPIAHVDAVRVPVLLLMGAADLRVAPTQGIGYYHALKAREGAKDGLKVEMLIFEGESHPLDGVEAAKVGWEAQRDWFAAAAAGKQK